MADRPIIFSAPMVLALLAGNKSQTRRVMRPQPEIRGETVIWMPRKNTALGSSLSRDPMLQWRDFLPYQAGDRLYVRENFAVPARWTGSMTEIAQACENSGHTAPWCPIRYLADGLNSGDWADQEPGEERVCLHMPRWASRITLMVSEVRAQRVQEISEADALAEGVAGQPDRKGPLGTARGMFEQLWGELHGEDSPNAWAENPWVVAITFAVVKGNIDSL